MWNGFLNGLVEVIYPKTCVVCKGNLKNKTSIDNLICLECWAKIKINPPPFCYCCGRHLKTPSLTKNICAKCVRKQLHFDRAFSPCAYDGIIKELIHNFKYGKKDYLGATLSRLIIEFIKEYSLPMDFVDLIVPIPLHETKLREREFNQAQILGGHIAKEFNKIVSDDILIRNRYTNSQTGLEFEKRLSNIKGSFSISGKNSVKGKNILLLDDVLTTGATSSEAAYILKNSGANIVFVLTLAN